jgi:hypothetical protein
VSYTAGAGESANITMHVTAQAAPVGDSLYIDAAVSQNAAPFTVVTSYFQAAPMSNGVAHVGTSKRFPLVAGTTYVFGAALGSNAPQTVTTGTCHGLITITK